MLKSLAELPSDLGLEAVEKFGMASLETVRSKTGFMVRGPAQRGAPGVRLGHGGWAAAPAWACGLCGASRRGGAGRSWLRRLCPSHHAVPPRGLGLVGGLHGRATLRFLCRASCVQLLGRQVLATHEVS